MADKGSADTFEYELAGRVITFRRTTSAQLLMLQRMVTKIQQQLHLAAENPDVISELMSQLNSIAFEAAESRFIDPADLEFVQIEVLRGNISQEQIMGIISNGKVAAASEPDDDADPAPPKRVRKAAVTKPAARRRAAR